ncbi:MAG TPA: hypothetical protein PKD55_12495, partial [Bellilinea sp.]|nr:hypothetical protein [Bellilinea sp.]
PDDLYFAVIASDNVTALKLLAGKRPPMGIHLRPLGGVRTFSLLTKRHAVKLPPGIEIRQGNKEILAQIIAFLSECGKHQQFFPCVSAEDLTGGVRFRGLALEDIYLAYRQGQLAGVLANWDQSAFKQDIVARYSPALRTFGGVYNLFAKVIGRQPLPNIGAAIPLNFGALGCVGDNDPELFKALLQTCINAAAMKHKGYFLLSMHESDPLLLVVQRFMHIGYRSELFAYSWSAETLAALDDRLPYIEAATL